MKLVIKLLILLTCLSGLGLACAQGEERMEQFFEDNPRQFYAQGAAIVQSNMQDLSVEWFGLPRSEGTGGALAEIGGILIVVRPKGQILWADLVAMQGPYTSEISVPMNQAAFTNSAVFKTSGLDKDLFRTTGAYAEHFNNVLRLYVSHHVFDEDCIFVQVSSIDLEIDRARGLAPASKWRRIFRPRPCIHIGDASWKPFAGHQAGGRMVEFDDGHLLLAVGDHEIDGTRKGATNAPQDAGLPYGKVWKIAKDGGSAELLASGFRNPQGLLAASDGTVWLTEHGPQGGDELNIVKETKNYGWPLQTFGVAYGDSPWPLNPKQGDHTDPRYEFPVFAWVPSIAPSNLSEVVSDKFPLWRGDFLLATLKDRSIRRLRRQGVRIVYDERIEVGQRLRDIVSLEDGRIVVLTDNEMVGVIDDPGSKLLASQLEKSYLNRHLSVLAKHLMGSPDSDGGSVVNSPSYLDFLARGAGALLESEPVKAIAFLEEAQRGGHPTAKLVLAELLSFGRYVTKDIGRAEQLFFELTRGKMEEAAWAGLVSLYLENPEFGNASNVLKTFQRALEKGEERVRYRLGLMLMNGGGIRSDPAKARQLLEAALDDGDRKDAAFALGKLYARSSKNENIQKAIDSYRIATSAGNAPARLELAKLIIAHRNNPLLLEEAERLLHVEAALGDRSAAHESLGDLYSGSSAYSDRALARENYEVAIAMENNNALIKLARHLASSDEPSEGNLAHIEKLLFRAENAGLEMSALRERLSLYNENGFAPNESKHLSTLKRLVELDDVQSMVELGARYVQGKYLSTFSEAEALLLKAARSGAENRAYYLLGELYIEHGRITQATDSFNKSAKSGNIFGAIRLAKLAAVRAPSFRNFTIALKSLENAIRHSAEDVAPAWNALGDLYSDPRAPYHSREKAIDAYERASDLGDVNAKVSLGKIYANVKLGAQNLRRAEELLTEAVSLHRSPEAALLLAELLLKNGLTPTTMRRAVEYYELAGAAGLGEAYWTLATLKLNHFGDIPNTERVAYFRKAAVSLGLERLANRMMLMPSELLVAAVQQMLLEGGMDVKITGAFDSETSFSAMAFCKKLNLEGCRDWFVTQALLVGLLSGVESSNGAAWTLPPSFIQP